MSVTWSSNRRSRRLIGNHQTDLAPDFELPLIQEKAQDQNKQPTDQVLSTDPNLVKLFQAPNKILPFRELDRSRLCQQHIESDKANPAEYLENLVKDAPVGRGLRAQQKQNRA